MNTPTHVPTTTRGSRRANVIIFVVAILAVISISAASYVTMTSLGRSGAASYQNRRNPLIQRDAVISHIGDLLAADLYGNKVVTVATKQFSQAGARIIPRPFEDGEFFDVPYTVTNPASAFFSFDNREIDELGRRNPASINITSPSALGIATNSLSDPLGNSIQRQSYQVAFPDDAWLASTEPVDNRAAPLVGTSLDDGFWDTWPQITNLRSAYYWEKQQSGEEFWVRDTGRYVDLGNFFLSDVSESQDRGDPSATLTNLTADRQFPSGYLDDRHLDPTHLEQHPSLARNQQVYRFQMNHMNEFADPNDSAGGDPTLAPDTSPQIKYTHADTRMWMDTDGDARPDARWQELDAFNNLFGWRWFVAARIIDSSASVNVNTSLGPGDTDDPTRYANGLTPADVDLFRLLDGGVYINNDDPNVWSMVRHPDLINTNGSTRAQWSASSAKNHIQRGIRLYDIEDSNTKPSVFKAMQAAIADGDSDDMIDEFNDHYLARTGIDLSVSGRLVTAPQFGTNPYPSFYPEQRETFYRLASSNFLNPRTPNTRIYSDENEIDLRAFWGYSSQMGTSPLEFSLDSTYEPIDEAKRTPSIDLAYGDSNSLGLLRSNEDMFQVRVFEEAATDAPGLGGSVYDQEKKVRRIMADTRRLVTTYSGEGQHSPVPTTSASAANAQRLDVNDDSLNSREYIERAFSGFMWALAPLAVDRPMAPGLVGNNFQSSYPYSTQLVHYGGNVDALNSPAKQWLVDLQAHATGSTSGFAPSGGSDPTDPGVSYALVRALSLAVNLRDATDIDSGDPNDHSVETPSVARFLPLRDANNPPIVSTTTGYDAVLTSIFQHGTLRSEVTGGQNSDALPESIFGLQDVGITAVGLDAQPFFVEASSIAVYSDAEGTGNGYLDAGDEMGFILAIELGNPWPFDINLADYTLGFDLGNTTLDEISLGDLALPISPLDTVFDQTSVIAAESTKVFFIVSNYEDSPSPEWKIFYDDFLSAIDTNPVLNADVVLLDQQAATFDTNVVTAGTFPWSAGITTPLYLLTDTLAGRVLVDRLTPPTGGDRFPAALNAAVDLTNSPPFADPLDGTSATGRGIVYSSLARADQQVNANGFPQYLFENRDWNFQEFIEPFTGDDGGGVLSYLQLWRPGSSDTTINFDPGIDAMANMIVGSTDWTWTHGDTPNDAIFGGGVTESEFQLFMPDGQLLTRSELLRLSPYAHLYFNDPPPSTVQSSDRWWTISEQLASPHALFYNNFAAPAQMSPYAGMLDPTRFVLGTTTTGADLRLDSLPLASAVLDTQRTPLSDPTEYFRGPLNHLAVPLALRVVDAFEVLGSNGDLAQGKININTAPEPVLRVLPHMEARPVNPTTTYMRQAFGAPTLPSISNWPFTWIGGEKRIRMIQAYRDQSMNNFLHDLAGTPSPNVLWDTSLDDQNAAPYDITGGVAGIGISGLRGGMNSGMTASLPPNPNATHDTNGFASLGELAILGQWDNIPTGNPTPNPTNPGMMEGATDPQNQGSTSLDEARLFNLRTPGSSGAPYLQGFNPPSDPHERMLNFQAISNIVSTRSDVYAAWFVLRAYSPADIEAVEVTDSDPADRVRTAMDESGFAPRHESRWFVVFDRSNVKQPTDRPNIVLIAQLPLTSP
ncbi:MAG: hypothetical protein ACYTF7_04560 [Planctomycetota bacterium]|jgi:hypothetical protein